MSDSYEIFPKIPVPKYGAVYKTRTSLEGTFCPEVDFDEDLHKDANLHIPEGTMLFYVEDVQFYSTSKMYRKPMSAWIRMHFITNDKRSLWVTILCSQQRVWDFETFRRRKQMVAEQMNELFELILSGEDKIPELEEDFIAPEQVEGQEV